ncbi:hypothetical protein NKZ16_06100 [Sinorhizobium meliloti]|uniref:hypothetical protein n=1 Tax=Rhizobium meliloti TaxID=382 RepID=UPI003D64A1D3
MPLDDFRRQIPERVKLDFDALSGCAERYRVSLMAAILRWLHYTGRRAVLVVCAPVTSFGHGQARPP